MNIGKKSEILSVICYVLYWITFVTVGASAISGNKISQVISLIVGICLFGCFIFLIGKSLNCILQVDNEVAKNYESDIGW